MNSFPESKQIWPDVDIRRTKLTLNLFRVDRFRSYTSTRTLEGFLGIKTLLNENGKSFAIRTKFTQQQHQQHIKLAIIKL